ncbi:bifunctional phosphoribosyl-AMP cyclohydrolase/phosphoribosyl-ATP diphosphatase HisIE [Paenibacillus sp. FSL R7-0048]|jgi:phosphoribosyl-ATP pyrophosphohydrolase/phosphoribosyl-AMP cyclohydrolase|uniref:bifunctional phosphoribosyl-AMP cyclohydrolase/phosphoribosyl-ATP diphosphatase HisIE n=1 Tax=Paenibacillus TaxID=44249 RepID=UPI00096C93F1|nr:bifunctional phosphoribosyl-AMP cyclohydrolase/phosphoribosyl-ATP diphosphatase HisIE [Paenibacillus odorifer]OMD63402.1 bifunctional phosphoribosyl-AMP cyclohydrolase/phosphoribosyl-ATP pyrophosphatase [Paenibacillus odorifer]OMD77779.1 bifunctional phosphoribosyl-AMP cyclohydrolase/phosphoribosyl-ATP pyrophosphatase [Paenibacillus odorifer]OMD82772.1 bifunctional phosphoribosyl-AMP cyclohydrolase/phosphoribosyl-ATP pyrophosphatase [Paenibacillus odorifer]OMD92041.1 bifunctional phosphoribo
MSETQNNTTLSQKEALAGIRWNEAGLVPAVVQDASSLEVLMVAYMNSESLQLSLESGQTWFWSRSRSELWHKGGTSGNTQAITSISYDCDSDTLLVKVVPEGPACHTGATSCFFREIPLNNPITDASKPVSSLTDGERFAVLGELERVIAEREVERPEGAYTTYLFDKGVDKILKKVGEEASETIIAAKNKDNAELRLEVSDLIYHLLVLLQERKLPLDEIMEELSTRHERPRRDQY